MGVGIGDGNSLMGDKHLPKEKAGTSRVMVGLLELVMVLSPDSRSFLGFKGSKTSTMICEEALVGDMEGDEDAEPSSEAEIFLMSLC